MADHWIETSKATNQKFAPRNLICSVNDVAFVTSKVTQIEKVSFRKGEKLLFNLTENN